VNTYREFFALNLQEKKLKVADTR